MNTSMKNAQQVSEASKLQSEKVLSAAKKSRGELGGLPRDELRSLARGWIPGFSRMSKDVLTDAIFLGSNPLREALATKATKDEELDEHLKKLVLPDDAPDNVHELADLVANLLVDFFNATPDREYQDSDFAMLAASIPRHIKGLKLEPGSKAAYKVKFFRVLNGLLSECQETIEERARSILTEGYLDTVANRELKSIYDQKNSITSKNSQRKTATRIKGQPVIDWAEKILENPTAPGVSIGHLSFAIAVATGRRMVEIHHSGVFALIEGDEEHLIFSGQAKMKGREAHAPEFFEIPVLVPASLVVEAVRILRGRGGLWDEPDGSQQKTEAVRMGRLAPDLNKLWGVEPWEVERVRLGANGEDVVVKKSKHLTHASMRKVYVQMIVYHYAQDLNHAVMIIRKALGHTSDTPGDEGSYSSASFFDYIDEFVLTDFNTFDGSLSTDQE